MLFDVTRSDLVKCPMTCTNSLAHITQPDIITVQETKLTTLSKTPNISNQTPIHNDRVRKLKV